VARANGARVTDVLFRSVIPRLATARRDAPAGTWAWSFDWPSAVSGGASHCIDLPFFFDLLDAEGVPAALGAHPPQELATAVHGDVVRFIHGADPDWPRAHGGLGDAARSYGPPGQPVATVERGTFDPVVAPGKPA
jgi:para-nitrobenzyl esterase